MEQCKYFKFSNSYEQIDEIGIRMTQKIPVNIFWCEHERSLFTKFDVENTTCGSLTCGGDTSKCIIDPH